MIRGPARRLAARILRGRLAGPIAAGAALLLRWTARPVGVVVMYHRTGPQTGDPDREFTPPLGVDAFDAQLALLRRRYRVVPAGEVLAHVSRRRRGERIPVAVTFDDDTPCHVEHALPVLRRHGLTATFFLNGIALGTPRDYWWERLQDARDAGRSWAALVPEPTLDAARELAAGAQPGPYEVSVAVQELDAEGRAEIIRRAREASPEAPASGMDAGGVRALVDAGMAVGWHGYAHEAMSLLSDEALAAELDRGRSDLERAAGASLSTIAYPYGRTDTRVADAARARGFAVGFSTLPVAVAPGDDPLLLGRIDGWQPSLGAFALELVIAVLRR